MKDFRLSKKWVLIIFSISIISVLFSIGYSQEVSAHSQGAYSRSTGAVQAFEPWMATISSDIHLTELSIPGTHDTMSDCSASDSLEVKFFLKICEGRGFIVDRGIALKVTITQTMSLDAQLDSGIRALDIRVEYRAENLDANCLKGNTNNCRWAIYHGDQFQGAFFDVDVLDVVLDFLNQHPTETVLMNLQHEKQDKGVLTLPLADFAEGMEALLKPHVDSGSIIGGVCSKISTGSVDIKLGNGDMPCDARGKLVIFSSGWGNDSGTYSTIGKKHNNSLAPEEQNQDVFDTKTMDRLHDEKWKKIKAHIDKTRTYAEDKFSFNSLSGTVPEDTNDFLTALATPIGPTIAFPYKVASGHSIELAIAGNEWSGITSSILGDLDTYPDFPRDECLAEIPGTPAVVIQSCDDPFFSLADCPGTIIDVEIFPAIPGIPASCLIDYEGMNIMTETCLSGDSLAEDSKAPGYPNKVCSNSGQFTGRLGIVQADFPGKDLINAVIDTNAQDCSIFEPDTDSDGVPNGCDNDDDNDTILDVDDNCPVDANPTQLNTDGDPFGDACDADDDNDTILDVDDNCPVDANPTQLNTDGDAFGDACDADDDNDNILDEVDDMQTDFSDTFSDGATTSGEIVDRGDQEDELTISDEVDPEGVGFDVAAGGGPTSAMIIACNALAELSLEAGDSGTITCGSVTVSVTTGSVDVLFITNSGPATTTMGATDSLSFDGTLTFTNNSLTNPAVITIGGRTITLGPGETLTISFPSSKTPYQDPNLGDVRHGEGHDNGFCMNQNCINVDGFFNHFPETIILQDRTQTFSLLINCPRGVDTCNHASIEGVLPDSDFYEEQWGVTLDRLPRSDKWETTVNNPYGEIGHVTTTVQEVDQTFLAVSFNIEFLIPGSIGTHDGIGIPHENNRHLHVTVWDSNRGISNYIFNEGVFVEDIYAFPTSESSYEKPLEVEQLCLNENPNKRYTCTFDKVKQWTIKNAEKQLVEINKAHGYEIIKEKEIDKVTPVSIQKLSGTSVLATIPMHQGYYNGDPVYYIITDSSDSNHADIISKNQGWKVETSSRLVNAPTTALSKTYMFANGVDGDGVHEFQGEIFTNTPAQGDVYSALTSNVLVTWDDEIIPRILVSEKEIFVAEEQGFLTLAETSVVLNMPQIVWPDGQMAIKVDKILTDATPYVGGQVVDIDLDEKIVTFIAHKSMSRDGMDTYYIVTDATPIGPANMMGVTYAPGNSDLVVNSAAVEMFQFMNGIKGNGPMGFQEGIVNSVPGDSNYSPIMRVFMIQWDDPSSASLIENKADIDEYFQDGLISVNLARPMYEHLIVNAPFIDPFQ